MSVVVAGYLSIDTITTPSGRWLRVPGGAALYAALGARFAGSPPTLCAMAGDDYPDHWLLALGLAGVDVTCIQRCDGPTRRATLAYAGSGGRAPAHAADPEWWARTVALAPKPRPLDGFGAVVACAMPAEHLRQWAEAARAAGVTLVADLSVAYAAQPAAILATLPQVNVFAPSLEETRLLCPGLDDDEAALALARLGPAVLQKRGPDGAVAVSGSTLTRLPAPPVRRVCDPTGAGDATVGALAAGLARGLPFLDAARAALEAGALAVSAVGPAAFGFAPEQAALV